MQECDSHCVSYIHSFIITAAVIILLLILVLLSTINNMFSAFVIFSVIFSF